MGYDEVPRGSSGVQALAVGRLDDPVGELLVLVALQDARGELGRVVAHGAGDERLGGAGGLEVIPPACGGGRLEDLVLGRHLLEVPLEALVLGRGLLLGRLEVGELGLEILDVLLLSLAEGSLTNWS